MEFNQLEAFVTVVMQGSFSRAADRLFLSQPTVSTHVKSLERELGTLLFDRGKNDLALTTAGESLYRYARDLLDLRSLALATIKENKKVGEEQFTIAASSVPCQYLLPQVVAEFEREFPTVSVSLHQENSRRVCMDISNYHYPLGVVGEKYPLPRLVYVPFLQDELVLAVPNRCEYQDLLEKTSLSLGDLAGRRLLLREPGSGTRSLLEKALAAEGLDLGMFRVTVYNSQETVKQAIRQGLGVSLISRFVVEDYQTFHYVTVRTLPGRELAREFFLVYHDKRVLTPAVEAIRRYITSFYSEEGSF